jgi:damage-control phosphatase, subfamily I
MKTHLNCVPCVVRQAVDVVQRVESDPIQQERLIRRILKTLSGIELHRSPPDIVQTVQRIIRDHTGLTDPYDMIKRQFNDLALDMVPVLNACIDQVADPFDAALRMAMAGNVIDFGVNGQIESTVVQETLDEVRDAPIDMDAVLALKKQISQSRRILYLLDNTGEIVFDRLFIERCLPGDKTIAAVRGAPVLNDATLEDARYVGLTDVVTTIDNGSDAPGTLLDDCSDAFLKVFWDADVIIAKGQGNYETLNEVQANIFFVLKVKCPIAARSIGRVNGSWVVAESQSRK